MSGMHLRTAALGIIATCASALSLQHFKRSEGEAWRSVQNLDSEASSTDQFVSSLELTQRAYSSIVALRSDMAMSLFVKRLLAAEDKFIPQDQEGELSGFVPWFSGTNATQSFEQLRQELAEKSWVKDLKTVDGAALSEGDYQAVAALRNNTAMKMFVLALLKSSSSFIPQDQESELHGFVPWFSGTNATQSIAQLRQELSDKSWVKDLTAINGSLLSEADYQGVAALRNDTAMKLLVFALLGGEKSFVPEDQEDEINGFLPWFSGTKVTQTLEQMRAELSDKAWVQKLDEESKAFAEMARKSAQSTAEEETNGTARNTSRQAANDTANDRRHMTANETAHLKHRQEANASTDEQSAAVATTAESAAFHHRLRKALSKWMRAFLAWWRATLRGNAGARSEVASNQSVPALKSEANGSHSARVAHNRTEENVSAAQERRQTRSNHSVSTDEHQRGAVAHASGQVSENRSEVSSNQSHQATTNRIEARSNRSHPSTDRVKVISNQSRSVAQNRTEALSNAHVSAARTETQQRRQYRANRTAATRVEQMDRANHSVRNALVEECSHCIVWGDANILSFNAHRIRATAHPNQKADLYARRDTADQFSVTQQGTYWLVKNTDVHIQGRYWYYNKSRPAIMGLGAIAISGPVVGNNILVIRSLSGELTWNGHEILQQVDSKLANRFVKAMRMSDVGAVAADTHTQGVQLEFANGMRLTVARYRNKLTARISICGSHAAPSSVEGQCGSLEMVPRGRASDWLGMQSAAEKLTKSQLIF